MIREGPPVHYLYTMSNMCFPDITPKSFDFGADYPSISGWWEVGGEQGHVGSHVRCLLPLCDASNIAPHHVLPPDCVSSQVDCDSRARYSTGLPKRRRSELSQSAAERHQDPVPPILMAPRSDSVVASIVSTADFRWSFSIVLDVTAETPPVSSAIDSTNQRRPDPPRGVRIIVPDFEAMLGEVPTFDLRNLGHWRP